ncbi:MAG: ATPase, T2SS/T4P/T4SS family [Devosia sp.]
MHIEARLREHIVSSNLLPPQDLRRALSAAETAHVRLDQALVELGLLTETKLAELLSAEFDIGTLAPGDIPAARLEVPLAPSYLLAKSILPIATSESGLVLAMADPYDDFTARAVALKTGRTVTRKRIVRSVLDRTLSELYGDVLPPLETGEGERSPEVADGRDVVALRDAASDAPVVRFVQDTIRAAVIRGASDIHLKPLPHGAQMLFRIDGKLEAQAAPDARTYASVISRLKILANLDIAERRLPQDGKLSVTVGGEAVDVRISTMAHVHGEGAVLRLLSRQLVHTSLADLGFSSHIESGLQRLTAATEGLIVVTGPTGSGKSTTLHAILQRLIRPDLNVVTVEDPVEYRVDGISQIQVDEKAGLTFPTILRSLLRQDPDIILVGEIRDGETAAIAVQAALTGHLVLATLHTNSALAAVPRLIDMGVEPYLLAAVMRGALAQRLVRRRCPYCAGEHQELHLVYGPKDATTTCTHCGGKRLAGRVAVGELALLDNETIEALANSTSLPKHLEARLREQGFLPMREDAAQRLRTGEIVADDMAAVA